MTTEKTITGKIKELKYRTISDTIDVNPYSQLEWMLMNNGIQITDSKSFKIMIDKILDDYNITKDKKTFNHMFEIFTGSSFRDFLNYCLGGERDDD